MIYSLLVLKSNSSLITTTIVVILLIVVPIVLTVLRLLLLRILILLVIRDENRRLTCGKVNIGWLVNATTTATIHCICVSRCSCFGPELLSSGNALRGKCLGSRNKRLH